MIKSKKVMAIVVLMFSITGAIAGDRTIRTGQIITSIKFDGANKDLYFETSGKWDAIGCDSRYIWVPSSVLGQKEILSIGLAAKMAAKKVSFSGECHTNSEYFKASYITVL